MVFCKTAMKVYCGLSGYNTITRNRKQLFSSCNQDDSFTTSTSNSSGNAPLDYDLNDNGSVVNAFSVMEEETFGICSPPPKCKSHTNYHVLVLVVVHTTFHQ
jgi:hypothetical protein